jgi:hypothetical protein
VLERRQQNQAFVRRSTAVARRWRGRGAAMRRAMAAMTAHPNEEVGVPPVFLLDLEPTHTNVVSAAAVPGVGGAVASAAATPVAGGTPMATAAASGVGGAPVAVAAASGVGDATVAAATVPGREARRWRVSW